MWEGFLFLLIKPFLNLIQPFISYTSFIVQKAETLFRPKRSTVEFQI